MSAVQRPPWNAPILSRAAARLLDAAMDYCAADALARAAREQIIQLKRRHDDGVPCCAERQSMDPDEEPEPPLPRDEWCEHCIAYVNESIDAAGSSHSRRSARQRMRRAHRDILATRRPLAELIMDLHVAGQIGRRFRASELATHLTGVFSDNEIRHWLQSGQTHFRQLEKYRFEIPNGWKH